MMMDDGSRLFLLGLAAVPACGPTINDEQPDDEDDQGHPGNPDKIQESCEAFFTKVFDCYSDMGGGGEPYDVETYCEYYTGYAERYGEDCIAAQEEMFSCASQLECAAVFDAFTPECRDAYASGHDACPELFRFCAGGSGSSGGTSCQTSGNQCLDGKEYTLRCESQSTEPDMPASNECECEVDGSVTGRFTSELSCSDEGLGRAAETACGWPEGVLF